MTDLELLPELSALIDRYGANLEEWPEAERVAALPLLAASWKARILMSQAEALEDVLRAGPTPADISPERVLRVMARTLAVAQRPPAPVPSVRQQVGEWFATVATGWARYGVPIAVGAVLGIVVGHASLPASATDHDTPAGITALIETTHSTGFFGS